jgi:hypothetical protein
MHVRLPLLALLLSLSSTPAAEISFLKGDAIKGDIVSVSDKEVVFKQGDKVQKRPLAEVLKIDYRDVGKPPSDKPFAQVELTDGTQVMVSKWLLRKKELELTLLAGPVVKLPAGAVANVLNNAQAEQTRREWKTRTFNTRGKEALVVNNAGTITNLDCTLGEGDDKGESISYAVVIGEETKTFKRSLAKLHGVIFKNTLDPKAPPMVCKLLDTIGDVVVVSSVAPREGGLVVTTPAGAKIDFSNEQIARLDYTPGRLEYLSDLVPSARKEIPNRFETGEAKEKWYVYPDTNLDKKLIKLGGATFNKGMTLLPDVELTYDLRGDYREFAAMVGIDDESKGEGDVTLVIEGDGRELTSVPISYLTVRTKTGEPKKPPKPVREVKLNIKDVQKLKVILRAKDELSGLSISLSLGNARVTK